MGLFSIGKTADSRLIDLLVEANKEKNEWRAKAEYWQKVATSSPTQYVPPRPPLETPKGEEVVDTTEGLMPRFSTLSGMRARAEMAAREKAKELKRTNDPA